MVLSWAEGPYLRHLDPRIRVVDLEVGSKAGSIPALARYMRTERPDVLLSALDVANVVALLARRFSRWNGTLVISTHIHLSSQARSGQKMHDWLLPWLARRLYPGADRIIAVSKGIADDLTNLLRRPGKAIDVIPNPIPVDAVRKQAEAEIDHPWFREGEPPVLLGVGRLNPQKDYPTLFRAVAKVRQYRKVRLIVLGEGPDRSSLERLSDQLGISDILAMPGFVDNPYAYMRQARLFVLSSRWEGFGLVVAEAMACGCPVLSTDCPSGPAEILEGGRYGRLTPVGDSVEMARAIEENLDAPVDSEILTTRAREFGIDRIASIYLEVLGLEPS
jgi:glycosyltransferase involved in cell wall biosynthesis